MRARLVVAVAMMSCAGPDPGAVTSKGPLSASAAGYANASPDSEVVAAPDAFHDFKWLFTEGANASGYMADVTGNAKGAGLAIAYHGVGRGDDQRTVTVTVSVTERFHYSSDPSSEYGGDAVALVQFGGRTIDQVRVAVAGATSFDAFQGQIGRRLVAGLVRSAKVNAFVASQTAASGTAAKAESAPDTGDDSTPPRVEVEVRDLGGHTQVAAADSPIEFAVPGTRWRCRTDKPYDVNPVPGEPDTIPFPMRNYSIECTTGDASAGLTLECPTRADNLRRVLAARHSKWLAELLVLIDRQNFRDERRFVTMRCRLPSTTPLARTSLLDPSSLPATAPPDAADVPIASPVPATVPEPPADNGGGPTLCADGTVSGSSGRGTCSHHGGEGGRRHHR